MADVIVDSGEGWGTGPARVKIVEPLQNVPEGLKEATIATWVGTSCHYRLRAGERYVIITDKSNFAIGACSTSFLLRGKEHILDAIRTSLQGGIPHLVGTVRKSTGRYEHGDGISGVTIEFGNGTLKRTAVTDGEGRYVIPNLQAGTYKFQVSRDGYVLDDSYGRPGGYKAILNPKTKKYEHQPYVPGEFETYASSCEVRDFAMWPAGRIEGTVRSTDGKPTAGVTVQAFDFDRSGERHSSPFRTAVTDSAGKYSIQPLPAGKYVLGINADTYDDESPYSPVVYSSGRPISVAEVESVAGIDLEVGAPRTPSKLKVRVVTSDGHPLQGAFVKLENSAGVQRWFSHEKTDLKGEITAPAYVGEHYIVKAFCSLPGEAISRELAGSVKFYVANPEDAVTVVLHEQRLQD